MKIDFKSFTKKYQRPKAHQFPTGSKVYKGFQGSGKTLSMVHDTFDLQKQFPCCIVYSNVIIHGLNNFHLIKSDNDLIEALTIQNGSNGVIILLDEAHLFFNKKTGISLDVLTAISQQRKDRRRLVFTSQIWEELDVSLRKQVKEVVSCRCLFGFIQINTISDGETLSWDNLKSTWTARKLFTSIYKHNKELYSSYDTYQKIIRNSEYSHSPSSQPISFSVSATSRKHSLFSNSRKV